MLWLLLLLVLLAAAAPPLRAAESAGSVESNEASLDLLLTTLRSNRKVFIAANLLLTEEEAQGFWPVYDRYALDLAAIQDRGVRLIEEYTENFDSMNDARGEKLVREYLQIERDHVDLRQAYLEPFSKVLPGVKLMRFYQIENKIRALLNYDLAATIPVVPEEPVMPEEPAR